REDLRRRTAGRRVRRRREPLELSRRPDPDGRSSAPLHVSDQAGDGVRAARRPDPPTPRLEVRGSRGREEPPADGARPGRGGGPGRRSPADPGRHVRREAWPEGVPFGRVRRGLARLAADPAGGRPRREAEAPFGRPAAETRTARGPYLRSDRERNLRVDE